MAAVARRRKPAGNERRAPRRADGREPWFDRARSLCELHGWPRSEPGDDHGLRGRYTAAVNRPVGQLDADELALLLTQGTDPRYLVPLALERVRAHEHRALLRCLTHIGEAYWYDHPKLRAAFIEIAEAAAPRLGGVDEDLADTLAALVARTRDR